VVAFSRRNPSAGLNGRRAVRPPPRGSGVGRAGGGTEICVHWPGPRRASDNVGEHTIIFHHARRRTPWSLVPQAHIPWDSLRPRGPLAAAKFSWRTARPGPGTTMGPACPGGGRLRGGESHPRAPWVCLFDLSTSPWPRQHLRQLFLVGSIASARFHRAVGDDSHPPRPSTPTCFSSRNRARRLPRRL